MAICINCGRSFGTISRECPYCHTPISSVTITDSKTVSEQKNNYDFRDNKLLLLSVLIPIFGIIYYFIRREEYPSKSSSALGGSFIGIIIIAIIISVSLIVKMIC